MDAASYIQFAAPDTSLTKAAWRPLNGKTGILKHYQSRYRVSPAPSRGSQASNGNSHLSDILLPIDTKSKVEVTNEARGILPFSVDDKTVRTKTYWCCGGDKHGGNGGSGANCQRVPAETGWCAGDGKCSEGCAFLALPATKKKRTRFKHMCNARLTLTWTQTSAAVGEVVISRSGDHVPIVLLWVPPSDEAAGITDEARAHFECSAGSLTTAVQSRENLRRKSPSAVKDKRRLPPLSQVSRLRKDINYSSASSNSRVGEFSETDSIIRDSVLSDNVKAANRRGDEPIVLLYDCSEENFQVVVSTPKNLRWAWQYGHGKLILTDAKNDLSKQKLAFTTMLAVDPATSATLPLAVSVSSSEGEASAKAFMSAMKRSVPCSESCSHEYRYELDGESAAYMLQRGCEAAVTSSTAPPPENFGPEEVMMDSDLSVRKGIDVGKCGVCIWHSAVAFEERLSHSHNNGTCSKPTGSGAACGSDFGISGAALGAMSIGKRICFRASPGDQDELDRLIKAFEILVRLWKASGKLPSINSSAKLEKLINYMRRNLGASGTPWSGCVGDVSGLSETTNNRVESHNNLIAKQLFFNLKGSSLPNLVGSKLLGRDRSGAPTGQVTYFGYFNEGVEDKMRGVVRGLDGLYYRKLAANGSGYRMPLLREDERARMLRGAHLALDGHVEGSGDGEHFYVRKGVNSGIRLPAREADREGDHLADEPAKEYDFSDMMLILRGPPGSFPVKPGFYTVTLDKCVSWC
jgi:hypothetical protein